MPKPAHLSIIELVAAIIDNHAEESMIERLFLSKLCLKDTEEIEEEEKRLINSLVNSGIDKLEYLYLNGNPEWLQNEEAAGYLFDFIKR